MCKERSRTRWILLLLILASAAPAMAQTVNPVAALAMDPTTPTTLYAGTPIGVFKSTDGGASWAAPTLFFNALSFAIDPTKPSTIYTNTHRSTDGGATWTAMARPGTGAVQVVMDPFPNPVRTLWAGTRGGLLHPSMFTSGDGGAAEWLKNGGNFDDGNPTLPTYAAIESLAADPRTLEMFAGSVLGGVARISRRPAYTGGWILSSATTIVGGHIRSIAIHPSDSTIVYATVSVESGNATRGVLKSSDTGQTFSYVNTGLPAQANATAIAINPAAPSTLYVGTSAGIYKSVNNAGSWAVSNQGIPGSAIINVILVDPSTPATIYAGTSLGIYKSANSGATWSAANKGLSFGISTATPTLSSLSMNSAPQDSIQDVTLAGTSLTFPPVINFGRGIVVMDALVNSSTSITARIQISQDASTLGPHDVSLTTAGGTSNSLPFTVTAGLMVPPAITSVIPASARQGATQIVTLTGTNFGPSLSVNASGSGVKVTSLIVTGPTSATAVITLGETAPVGIRSVQPSAAFGGAGSPGSFEVLPGFPIITTMSPSRVVAGRPTTVTLTGIRFAPPLLVYGDYRAESIQIENVVGNEAQTSVTFLLTVPVNFAYPRSSITVASGPLNSNSKTFTIGPIRRKLDFDCDGKTDLLWYNAKTGETVMSLMNGAFPTASEVVGRDVNWKVTAAGDFNGDGCTDLVWYNGVTGQTSLGLMLGTEVWDGALLFTDPAWHVTGVTDLNGDGMSDLIWYNGYSTSVWLMQGKKMTANQRLRNDPDWRVIDTGDFNEGVFGSSLRSGDGFGDLLWNNAVSNETIAWLMVGTSLWNSASLNSDPNWSVSALPDLDGDGQSDFIWHNKKTGQTNAWVLTDARTPSERVLLLHPSWKVLLTADLNGDTKSDLLWYNPDTGETVGWLMNGLNLLSWASLLTDADWRVTSTGDFNGDGKTDLVWTNERTGETVMWLMNGLTVLQFQQQAIDPNWRTITPGR